MESIGVRSRIHGPGLDDRLESRANSQGMVESQEGCWYDYQIAGQVMLSAGPRRREDRHCQIASILQNIYS
ncbi:hypothetical protein EV421DRAFT_1844332 [Armillaria borealis]|uniref:Uncharacterized protein n=1 Tax=Armillaria borealis TaxID=47425 RepID=A0AA39J2A6_9AGAR|nr:hypothetical protein EV421DRAFT_1844332 [Armillaria borealis]